MTETSKMLRELRKYHGKTLREISRHSGLSVSYLSDMERGHATPIDAALTTLNKILAVYGLEASVQVRQRQSGDMP